MASSVPLSQQKNSKNTNVRSNQQLGNNHHNQIVHVYRHPHEKNTHPNMKNSIIESI